MKQFLFSVYDKKAESFSNPQCVPSQGQALRSFSDEVNRVEKGNILNEHCEDFVFYCLGEFDTDSGDIRSFKSLVAEGSNVIVKVS